MKKLNISRFDIGFIIAFVIVTLLGVGAWYYLSGALRAAKDEVAGAKQKFDTYSVKYKYVVSKINGTTLQTNIDLIKAQLDPVISAKLLPKENTLHTIQKEDPVAWKHDLEQEISRLNAAAKVRGVVLPPSFYYGFSRYVSASPGDEQTAVLSKQLVAVEQLANILINAPVKSIKSILRTNEEDHNGGGGSSVGTSEALPGYSLAGPGNTYTDYPFELNFETTPENFRPVINNLVQSPYLFVIRAITVKSSKTTSPRQGELATIAGTPPAPPTTDAAGAEMSAPPVKGPQYLFGNATLIVKIKVDLIEWNPEFADAAGVVPPGNAPKNPATPGGNR